jgi:hypothetical protein
MPAWKPAGDVAPAISSRLNWSLAPEVGPDDEPEAVCERADHRIFSGARGGCEDSRSVPQAWDQRGDLLQLKEQVRRPVASPKMSRNRNTRSACYGLYRSWKATTACAKKMAAHNSPRIAVAATVISFTLPQNYRRPKNDSTAATTTTRPTR